MPMKDMVDEVADRLLNASGETCLECGFSHSENKFESVMFHLLVEATPVISKTAGTFVTAPLDYGFTPPN